MNKRQRKKQAKKLAAGRRLRRATMDQIYVEALDEDLRRPKKYPRWIGDSPPYPAKNYRGPLVEPRKPVTTEMEDNLRKNLIKLCEDLLAEAKDHPDYKDFLEKFQERGFLLDDEIYTLGSFVSKSVSERLRLTEEQRELMAEERKRKREAKIKREHEEGLDIFKEYWKSRRQ